MTEEESADGAGSGPDDADGPRDHPDRMLSRPSPLDSSASRLVSRDYRPRTGGPELVTSWPLGPAPAQSGVGVADWELACDRWTTIQRTTFTLPYLGGVDYAPLYLNVRGRATVPDADGGSLRLELAATHLRDGKPYETRVRLLRDGDFQSPMVEVAPDRPGDYHHRGDTYGGYELRALTEGGTARLDPGTAVQLFSE